MIHQPININHHSTHIHIWIRTTYENHMLTNIAKFKNLRMLVIYIKTKFWKKL